MTSTTTSTAIAVRGLRKRFGEKVVLDGVDLDVPERSVVALLGPNGAGKTTIVRILATLLHADGGSATVAGHELATDPRAVRGAIGVTGQFAAVDNLLTGEENLLLMGRLQHLGRTQRARRATELLDRFDLAEAARKPAATYSGGMRRRLDLAMSLVGEPRVLFLDEPTTGLDPRSRRTLWEIVRDLVSGGVTVLLTTQYLEEADQLADRIAVLDHGSIVAEGTPRELKRRVPGGHVNLTFADRAALHGAAHALGRPVPDVRDDDSAFALRVPGTPGVHGLKELLSTLDAAGVEPDELSVHHPDLDDVFLSLTGDSDRTEATA
ncbi:ABC transporter [Saccharomonospora piscinae]|uniref:ABC transporter n=1 Tax=Saccharomonospora piscinae TaxID=687388 RepID=A0A1V9A7N8_SACPI|nr:ATP-binding cassette domain-containing protein [Saccharomonospora piscinae]OQO93111.1 ABC transporter [Saccharomonospora piscinae]